jgi:hypothetical protein
MTQYDYTTWQAITSIAGDEAIRQIAGQTSHNQALTSRNEVARNHSLRPWLQYQADLRKKSWPRFPKDQSWFWTDTLLQQASDWQSAVFKAKQFPNGCEMIDLCCGVGVDTVALTLHQHQVTAIDLDPLACFLAAANLSWHLGIPINQSDTDFSVGNHQVLCEDARKLIPNCTNYVHVDPDRRPDLIRTTQVDLMEPPLSDLESLLTRSRGGMIKLAPASQVTTPWSEKTCRLWIGDRRQCRQQLLVWGLDTFPVGTHCAADISHDTRQSIFAGDPQILSSATTEPEAYLFDFQPSIRAANLTGALADHLNVKSLGDVTGYLTGSTAIDHPLVDSYRVIESTGWDEKKVKRLLRAKDIGRLTVKKRGCRQLDPNRLQNSLSSENGNHHAVLLLAEIGRKQIAILAEHDHN